MVNKRTWIQMGVVLGIVFWGMGTEAAPLSIYSSFSVQSPKDRPNPFDYEFTMGLELKYTLTGHLVFQRERDNGRMYTDQEYKMRYRRGWSDIQVRYLDSEEARLFIHSYAVALKPVPWIGMGLTRQYTRRAFGQGAWLGHVSMDRTWTIHTARLVTLFTYESNLQRRRIFGKMEIRGMHLGPLQVIPFGVYEGLKVKGKKVIDRYQGKIKLQIDVGGSKKKEEKKESG